MSKPGAKTLFFVIFSLLLGFAGGWFWWGLQQSGSGRQMTREQVRRIFGEFGAQQYDKIIKYGVTSEGLLRVGDRAPNLQLQTLEGGSQPISAYYRDKPLVLTFGSYT